MKVALLSDLHGNLPACEAVLAEAKEKGYDKLAVLGDIVGVLGWPDETVEFVEDHADYAVLGNHDCWVHDAYEFEATGSRVQEVELVESMLTEKSFQYLHSLPEQINLGEHNTIFAHAKPNTDNPTGHPADNYLDKRNLTKFGSEHMDGELICVGHTHIQYGQSLDKFEGMSGTIVNPGSVGAPWYKDAKWAIVDTETQEFELHRTHYDTTELTNRFNLLGLEGWDK